jgi:hypothetical protein
MFGSPVRRRRLMTALLSALLAGGMALPARADDGPLPEPCKLHPVHLVNPGCAPALVDGTLPYEHVYPDLVPDVTEVFVTAFPIFDPETRTTTRDLRLNFDTWSQNLGTVPLDLLTDDPTNQENPTVSQCLAWTERRLCRERRTVGGFVAHPTHGHIHFDGFATYELRSLLADDTPDYSAGGLLRTSEKVSFCLVDLRKVRNDADPVGTYMSCDGLREGISPGWADIYGSHLDGQDFPIEGLADGEYGLVVTLNPEGNVFESDRTNNRMVAIVELSQGGLVARLVSKSVS